MIASTINGHRQELEVRHPDETALDLLRRQGLTGAKLVCRSGVCGACTILVDGLPMTACLLPVHHLEGREVQAAEYHHEGNLHPVHRALIAHDGLQCGFCTPGFVNSGSAYHERWRAEKAPRPLVG